MSDLTDPITLSLLAGLTGAAAFFSSKYVCLPGQRDTYRAHTKQITDAHFGEASQLGVLLSHEFEALKEQELRKRQKKGDTVSGLKLVENEVRRKSGFPVDIKIFERKKSEDVKLSCGLLVSNSVSARDYRDGEAYEVVVHALYEGMRKINRIETCVAAYDTDLHLIKAFDNSYDTTPGGILIRKKGHHAMLGEALRLMGEQFEDARHRQILYVITGPIRSRRERAYVEQQLEMLKARHIQVAFLYINPGKRDLEEPLSRYQGVVDPEDLAGVPKEIRRINNKIMETSA